MDSSRGRTVYLGTFSGFVCLFLLFIFWNMLRYVSEYLHEDIFLAEKSYFFVVKAQAVHALGKFEDIICFYVPGQNKNFHSLLYHVK